MHGRNFGQTRSRSGCCPPGCCLPCCAPRRRRRSPKVNPCIFIPPPGLATKRYCGDPCSPPPPACIPKPLFMRRTSRPTRRARTSMACDPCCDPCPPRSRPLRSSSPRSYSRPYRPYSDLFSSINPCRPKKCGPLDPCTPGLTNRCIPCMPRSLCDPCLSSTIRYSSPCCYKGNKSSCKPRRKRSSMSPKFRSSARRSSSHGSSYCESPCSQRPASKRIRCKKCKVDPCCCKTPVAATVAATRPTATVATATRPPATTATAATGTAPAVAFAEESGHEEKVELPQNEDTAKGPTSWFLKQSEKCGQGKSSNEPHLCPWEAEVTVTGTVRGHCTSTAVEVAKRLTGKFSSKGQRYTSKKKKGSKYAREAECKPQRMALGYLDDGTKLDFSRNRCDDDEDEDDHNRASYKTSRTNNANTEASRWSSHRGHVKVKDRKFSDRSDLHFATAYIGGDRSVYTHTQERHRPSQYRPSQSEYSRRCYDPADHHSYPINYKTYTHQHRYVESEASGSDQSFYKTASESVECCRGHHNSSRHDQDDYLARRKGRRRARSNGHPTDESRVHSNISGRGEDWWRQHNYHPTSRDENYHSEGGEDENDVINFNLVSEEDSGTSEVESDNDDIDKVNSQSTPPPAPTQMVTYQYARSRDRRPGSPVSYNRRSSLSRQQCSYTHSSRACPRSARHGSHSACLDVDVSSGQSSDEEPRDGRSLTHFQFRPGDRHHRHGTHKKSHSRHRKRVTYGGGL